MKGLKKLADSEKEIMNVIWKSKMPLCVNDVFYYLENSDWKYTTVATFLSRLEKKGFLKCEKEGNQNFYKPNLTREEYLSLQTDEFINDMYGGVTSNFIAGLCKNRISEQDYNELMEILKKYDKD